MNKKKITKDVITEKMHDAIMTGDTLTIGAAVVELLGAIDRDHKSEYKRAQYKRILGRALVHITKDHTGKMSGLWSISTNCRLNKRCQCRMNNPELICNKCFADALLNMYSGLDSALVRNYKLLNNFIIPADLLPDLSKYKNDIFRFESFGDVASVKAVINFYNIARKYPHITFTAWTKNPDFYQTAAENGHAKPDNFILIYSEPGINPVNCETLATIQPAQIFEIYPLVNKVFRVFDPKTLRPGQTLPTINCGARNCNTCRRCYKLDTENVINELLK